VLERITLSAHMEYAAFEKKELSKHSEGERDMNKDAGRAAQRCPRVVIVVPILSGI